MKLFSKISATSIFNASMVIGILIVILFLASLVAKEKAPERELTSKEKQLVEAANQHSCTISQLHCRTMKTKSVQYVVREQYFFEKITAKIWGLILAVSENQWWRTDIEQIYGGKALRIAKDTYKITISEYAFDDYAAILMINHHEWYHVIATNYVLIEDQSRKYEICLDHNNVRTLSVKDTKKAQTILDTEVNGKFTIVKSAQYYAFQHPGNEIEDCDKYKS